MGKNSKIQWTEATWNPWHGCKKVSPGCKFCYMYRDKDRYGLDPTTVQRSKTKFHQPTTWAEPRLIFTCSWSDWFIEEADEWREAAWAIIKATPEHTYQILTKRPERIAEHLPADWGDGYPNVWLGVSIESQKQTDRLWHLCTTPAKVRFVSAEPLIGELDFSFDAYLANEKGLPDFTEQSRLKHRIHWVIVGGESGNETGKWRYRPCKTSWIHRIVDDCIEANIPVFVKQLGTHLSKELGLKDRHGGDIEEFPDGLRIRLMPTDYWTTATVLNKKTSR